MNFFPRHCEESRRQVKRQHFEVLGYNGQAMRVEGVDEHLTGSPEEYLVPLNGLYLRQGKEDDVNGRAHYVLEPRMAIGLWRRSRRHDVGKGF